jgi:hypothetical protein
MAIVSGQRAMGPNARGDEMKKVIGTVLAGLGLLAILASTVGPFTSPNVAHFLGTYTPGLLFIFIGMALRVAAMQSARPVAGDTTEHMANSADAQIGRLEGEGNVGIVLGFATMLIGSGLTRQGPDYALPGTTVFAAGWLLLIYGCVNYAKWKGYSHWLGLLGYLLLPGLIVLACIPNRRKRLRSEGPAESAAGQNPFAMDDRGFGYRYALAFAPIGLFYAGFVGLIFSLTSGIDAAEWNDLIEPELGFRVSMRAETERDETTQATASGNVETRKFVAKPRGRKELFMIVAVTFPQSALDQIGGEEKLLELRRQHVITAFDGQLQSERRISLGGCPGLEVVVLPRKGAVVRSQMYVVGNQFYQVSVHVRQLRLSSRDVQRFFNSFQLYLDQKTAAAQRGQSPSTNLK